MNNAIIAIAVVVGLALLGFFLIILLPSRALPDVATHSIGDMTAGGLLKTVLLEV